MHSLISFQLLTFCSADQNKKFSQYSLLLARLSSMMYQFLFIWGINASQTMDGSACLSWPAFICARPGVGRLLWVVNLSPAMGRGIDSRNRVWNWVAKLHRLAYLVKCTWYFLSVFLIVVSNKNVIAGPLPFSSWGDPRNRNTCSRALVQELGQSSVM